MHHRPGARIQLCGRLEVEWDGRRLDPALPGRQGRLLFAYLTLHRDRPVRRDELVEALWSDGASTDGDARLRPVLSRLRRALGPDRLEGRSELALRLPDDAWVDVEAARAGLTRARERHAAGDHAAAWDAARGAARIAEHGLLPGLEAGWIDVHRAELEQLRGELLEAIALAGARLGHAELAEAERAARRAVALAPYRESARLALIDVLRRRGNPAEALVAYEEVRRLLMEELGSAPGPELRALHEELLRAEAVVPPASPFGERRLPDRLAQAAASAWVGRGEALGRLRAAAEEAAAGEAALVLVTGQGGIGKTRLLAQLAASLREFDVLYGRCDEEQLFPYGPWVELLGSRLDRMTDGELAEALGTSAADLMRLVPRLRDRLPAPAAEPAPTDPATERRHLFEAVTGVVSRLAQRRPLLVVIDDLHWADRSSLLLGRHLAGEARLGPVLLVGTFRDTELEPGHPLPDLIADLKRHRDVPRVRLEGMDDREVGALIGSLHDAAVEDATVRAIRAETDGNPFFVKQVVRHLEEAGGARGLASVDGLGVPEDVRDVIARRVGRLPEGAGQVLRVAALIGRDFDLDLLAEVAAGAEDDLLDALDAAVRGGLLVEVAPGRYSFAHALLRTALEAELTQTRRAVLHRRIGEVIEDRHRDGLEPWLEELARHFAQAGPGEVERAVAYAVRAAEQATSRLAHEEAARLLRGAVALRGGDPAALARLEAALAAAEAAAGQWEQARAGFQRAAAAARAVGDDEAFARAALGHPGGTWEQFGIEDAASALLLEEALDRLDGDDSALRVQVLARLAVVRYFSDVPEERVADVAVEALAMARRLGDQDAHAAALVAMLFARWRPGRAQERLALADELVALLDGHGNLTHAAEAHVWRAFALLELCRRDEAFADLARFDELAERLQHPQMLSLRDGLRGTRALLDGDYATGAAGAEAVMARVEREQALGQTPASNHFGFYIGAMLGVLGERGELDRVKPALEHAVETMGRIPGMVSGIVLADAQAGRTEQARAGVERLSADGFAGLPRDSNFLPALAIMSHGIAELGAGDLAARIEPLLGPFDDAWVVYSLGSGTMGPVAYSIGVLQLAQGRARDAVASFERALERSRAMRARPYVARSQAGLARAVRELGDDARAAELTEAAAATARELGMVRLERELAARARA